MENLVVAMILPTDVFYARELDKAMKVNVNRGGMGDTERVGNGDKGDTEREGGGTERERLFLQGSVQIGRGSFQDLFQTSTDLREIRKDKVI